MAAFTPLDDGVLADLVSRFVPPGSDPDRPPELRAARVTHGGIENTNYFVTLELFPSGAGSAGFIEEWVLTRIEMPDQDPRRTMALQARLHAAGLPVPEPAPAAAGEAGPHHVLHGRRPVVMCRRLRGHHIERPNAAQCRQLGAVLGRLHAQQQFGETLAPHPRDADWLHRKFRQLTDRALAAALAAPLARCMTLLDSAAWQALPRGAVHADLFVDNALFDGDTLTGVFDFHQAANAPLMTDVGVVVNEWCIASTGAASWRWIDANLTALIAGYAAERATTAAERAQLVGACELAALRTCLARALPDDGSESRKPPQEMLGKLAAISRRAARGFAWPAATANE